MTDFSTHYARTLAHYQKLYETPGWKDYVEARVADLAARHPDLYAELAAHFPKSPQRSSAARRGSGR